MAGFEHVNLMRDGRLRTYDDIELDIIAAALEICGSQAAAARALGIGRRTVERKVRRIEDRNART